MEPMSFSESDLAESVPNQAAVSNIVLHPIVLLNISDHMTRLLLQAKAITCDEAAIASHAYWPCLGMLLGVAAAGRIEVFTTYELVFRGTVTESVSSRDALAELVDLDAVRIKWDRTTQVYPEYRVVGWYCVGKCMGDLVAHRRLHRTLCDAFTVPVQAMLALMLDHRPSPQRTTLPVYVFEVREGREAAVGDQPPRDAEVGFTKVAYGLESEEMERIAMDAAMNAEVDHQVRGAALGPAGTASRARRGGESAAMVATIARLQMSLRMLRQHLTVGLEFLCAVGASSIRDTDPELLREVAGLCLRVPAAVPELGNPKWLAPRTGSRWPPDDAARGRHPPPSGYDDEVHHAKLIAYLAAMSRGVVTVQRLARARAASLSGRRRVDASQALRPPTTMSTASGAEPHAVPGERTAGSP